MRIANLTHGALFMLGAYIGVSVMRYIPNLWVAALVAGIAVAAFGGLLERLILRKLGGNVLGQVLVTLGVAFIIADACLVGWGGDPIPIPTPKSLQAPVRIAGFVFPAYRLAVVVIAVVVAIALYLLMERTRLGAMIRAGVDDPEMASAVGIPVSRLFTTVFCLGAALAGAGGVIGGPIMSAYPGLDADMLPLALIVVILGGVGSLLGAAAAEPRLRPLDGGADRGARHHADGLRVRPDRAARHGARLPDADARALAGAVGHRVPLGVDDRRRQRPARPRAPGALRLEPRQRDELLLLRAPDRRLLRLDDGALRRLGLRRHAQRRARPAAQDERAGLRRVADPLDHLRLRELLGRGVGPALRLLPQVHPTGIAVAL